MFDIKIQFFGMNPFFWRLGKISIFKLLIMNDIIIPEIGINIAK